LVSGVANIQAGTEVPAPKEEPSCHTSEMSKNDRAFIA